MESGQVEIMKDTQRARVKLYKINPLSLAKQILAMFASVNGPEFFETNPELRNLILDENSYGLDPSKYALFVYLYRGGMGRNSGISVIMTTDGMMTISSELTTVPFGFVLVLKPNRDRLENCGTEITGLFNDYEPEVIDDFMFEMPMYEQNGPMPLDFRTKEDIMKQMSSE
jgi:hypothetical protein